MAVNLRTNQYSQLLSMELWCGVKVEGINDTEKKNNKMEETEHNKRDIDDDMDSKEFPLRNYQLKLVEIAKKENTIIYLPTGSGKTLIAIHVLCSRANYIKRNFRNKDGGKRAFFVANTKVLVYQLARSISFHTKFRVGSYTGDMNVDSWDRNSWMAEFDKNHVLVLTAEILRQIIQLNFISLTDISLIVFDECHHAVADHPYRVILLNYRNIEQSEAPLILGLTGVLLLSNPKEEKVSDMIRSLENTYCGKVVTEAKLKDIMSFVSNPQEKLILYNNEVQCPLTIKAGEMLKEMLCVVENLILQPTTTTIPTHGKSFKDRNKAKLLKKSFENIIISLVDLGPIGASLAALYYIIYFEQLRLQSDENNLIQALIYGRTELNKLRRVLIKGFGEETSASIYRYASPKVQALIKTVCEIYATSHENKSFTIVFVQRRVTAIVLGFLFKRLSVLEPKLRSLKAEFAVGHSLLNKDSMFGASKNEEIVEAFSARSLNFLVATNLLEEGMDVTACNFVISFDYPMTYASYFQSRGRARDKKSVYYLFIEEKLARERKATWEKYKFLEAEVQMLILGELRDPDGPEAVEAMEELSFPGKKGNIVTDAVTAIKVVFRYCNSLPQDKFSSLCPTSWYTESGGCKRAFLQLPRNCPIKEIIEGDKKRSIKLAKRSVFLKAVKKLYEIGQLDDDLNPISIAARMEDYEYLFPHYKKENIPEELPQPGTKKRRQDYEMAFAESLSGCLPQPGVKAYLHVINLAVAFPRPDLERKTILHDILKAPVTYAILSGRKLTRICQFPLFLDMGQINCDLWVNYAELVLNEVDLNKIKLFHISIFQKVMNAVANYQVFDKRNKEQSFFVVPVKKNEEDRFVLDWDLIKTDFCQNNSSALVRYNPSCGDIQKKKKECRIAASFPQESSLLPVGCINGKCIWGISEYSINEEPRFVMLETDYSYFVLRPNYRTSDFQQFYIVKRICHELSPLSQFPRDIYQDYFTYYKEKYNIEITNSRQPLLNVAPIFKCTNFNLPRKADQSWWSRRNKGYNENLVPELCDIFPFDRRYWLKALLLPTALNRIHHLYHVDEFRRRVVRETGLGVEELPEGRSWRPLEVLESATEKEGEEEFGVDLLGLKSSLPVSKLKDTVKSIKPDLMDPERCLYDIGLCDLQHFVNGLSKTEFEDEYHRRNPFVENEEVIRLISSHGIPAPSLEALNPRNSSGPELADMIEVFTAKSANDIVNYERLEILGDSFLKFATTLFLFSNYDANEGILTSLKGKLVGNKNLLYCGLNKNIQRCLSVVDFVPRLDWIAPLFCVPDRLLKGVVTGEVNKSLLYQWEIPLEEQVSGEFSEATFKMNQHLLKDRDRGIQLSHSSVLPFTSISDKTVSDCVEAFLGAYLLSLGLPAAFSILSWFEILPKGKCSYAELMSRPYDIRLPHKDNPKVIALLSQVFHGELEETIGYKFKNKALLLEALTHPSFSQNRVTNCYQRLEFLGDAILDFLITVYVYETCGNLTPGQVTDIRASLVNNVTFACLAVRYDLHKYLLSCNVLLNKAIENFVSHQITKKHAVDENVLFLLEETDCFLAESVQVPKALGDLFESLAGAIFLDSGNSLETVWDIYYRMMKREIDDFTNKPPKSSIRYLHEICDERPRFRVKAEGPVVRVVCSVYYSEYELETYGFGVNKKEAKKSACKLALKKILELNK